MRRVGMILFVSTLAFAANRGEFHSISPQFTGTVLEVRSIAPEKRVGFGKSLPLYAVTATGPDMSYTLYCLSYSPEAGKTYTMTEAWVTENFAPLKLWPGGDRKKMELPAGVPNKGPALYRVVEIDNALPGPQSSLACEIYKEAPIAHIR